MKYKHDNLEFELNDEWIAEARMQAFKPTESSYRADLLKANGQEVLVISIDEIAPLKDRANRKGVFCDNEQDTAKERVVRILEWFREYEVIEPISVAVLNENGQFKYKALTGCHRLYCSIAVGFTRIPAILTVE
jgi:uncharacterized ParB-like nuclease family protein